MVTKQHGNGWPFNESNEIGLGNPKKPNLPALHNSWYDSTYKKGF